MQQEGIPVNGKIGCRICVGRCWYLVLLLGISSTIRHVATPIWLRRRYSSTCSAHALFFTTNMVACRTALIFIFAGKFVPEPNPNGAEARAEPVGRQHSFCREWFWSRTADHTLYRKSVPYMTDCPYWCRAYQIDGFLGNYIDSCCSICI